MAWVFTYEVLAIEFSFSVESTGVIFALVEFIGGLMNLVGKPLIEEVGKSGPDVYYYTMLASSIGLISVNFIQLPLTFGYGKCLVRLVTNLSNF